jgi:tripartite-type tricarboxylate transporter receptor subunit TctC
LIEGKRMHDIRTSRALLVSVVLGFVAQAHAADFPTKPIRMLVGGASGGGVDITARIVAAKLSESLKQQCVVENRAGASGNIASEIVVKAAADGYTILMGTIAPLAINPSLYPNLPFDPARDFAPISRAADSTNVLVIHPSLPAKNIKELVAIARARPGQLLFGSAQAGSAGHLAGELFNAAAHVKTVHVPYKGGAPAMIDLMSGQLQMIFATAITAVPQIRSGRVRPLAVTTAKRSALLPEVPTMHEAGLSGFEVNNWYGVVAPARTPPEIVRTLNREVVSALGQSDVRDVMLKQGLDPAPSTPEEFGAYIRSEIAKWRKVVQASGARAD